MFLDVNYINSKNICFCSPAIFCIYLGHTTSLSYIGFNMEKKSSTVKRLRNVNRHDNNFYEFMIGIALNLFHNNL